MNKIKYELIAQPVHGGNAGYLCEVFPVRFKYRT